MGSFVNPENPYPELFPQFNGTMSIKSYRKSDCDVVRYTDLSVTFYDQKMGGGDGRNDPFINVSNSWEYPPPDTVMGVMLNYVCDYVD